MPSGSFAYPSKGGNVAEQPCCRLPGRFWLALAKIQAGAIAGDFLCPAKSYRSHAVGLLENARCFGENELGLLNPFSFCRRHGQGKFDRYYESFHKK